MTTTAPPTDPGVTTPATNVNVSTTSRSNSNMWTTSRVIALVFTVIEVLLLVRFVGKLLGANAAQGFVAAIYGITEPLVAPFRGIFTQPDGTQMFEIASLLSIIFFVLVAALILAMVRAFTGKRAERDSAAV
jgi:nucleoside recognition membrane protein YjiH